MQGLCPAGAKVECIGKGRARLKCYDDRVNAVLVAAEWTSTSSCRWLALFLRTLVRLAIAMIRVRAPRPRAVDLAPTGLGTDHFA